MKKAIAYTSDIILGRTGDVISRAYQKELIRQYASENNIEVVAWFEDELLYEEEVLKRPGIQALLAYDGPVEIFLVERVWALSRSIASLREFFAKLALKRVRLETAAYLWDCTSQMVRRQIAAAATAPQFKRVVMQEVASRATIAKPDRLHFVGWAYRVEGESVLNEHEQAA